MIDFNWYEICRNCYFYKEVGVEADRGTCNNEDADFFGQSVDAECSCFDYEEKDDIND